MTKSQKPADEIAPQNVNVMFQEYFRIYAQAMADTLAYTAKMSSYAADLTQMMTNAGTRVARSSVDHLADVASQPGQATPVPDPLAGVQPFQEMMRQVAAWQQQIFQAAPPYMNGSRSSGEGAARR